MADCTKTVEFLREWKRLFDNTEIISLKDPKTPREVLAYNQIMSDLEHPEKTIEYVQKWSDEHPALTWAGKLNELLPNAKIEDIINMLCPRDVFGDKAPDADITCNMSCGKCWAGEYKEAQ